MEWSEAGLSEDDQAFLSAVKEASSLAELSDIVGVADEHEAYIVARERWRRLREGRLDSPASIGGVSGDCVTIGGHDFWVHGITHADTEAEGSLLREAVREFLDDGAVVYCEQGIRGMYFDAVDGVCEMDDYRWALRECQNEGIESQVSDVFDGDLEAVSQQVTDLAARFQKAAFSLIESGSDVYGERFERALGDLASDLVTTHEDVATGRSFESFERRQRAAEDPSKLAALQQYYRLTFLPQALEREWLSRHDPELAIVTHGRNKRMSDYVVYHNESAERVHLIVGAAHQPGVVEHLRAHRDGERTVDGFELV